MSGRGSRRSRRARSAPARSRSPPGAVATPGCRAARPPRGDASASPSPAHRVRRGDEQLGERDRLAPQARDAGRRDRLTPHSSAARLRIGGVPHSRRAIPGGGPVAGLERERLGVAHPARERRVERVLVPARDERERRRARPPVQVLVAAADREVGPALARSTGTAPGAVREVEERERALRVRGARPLATSWISPVRKSTCVSISTATRRRAGRASRRAARPELSALDERREALRDIEVGGEVLRLGQDHAPAGAQRAARRRAA